MRKGTRKKRLYNKYMDIWQVGNASGHTAPIRALIERRLKAHGIPYTTDTIGNLYAGDFTKPAPCLVAHMDSVHKEPPRGITCNKKGILRARTGIGGDDKCGIVALLELLPARPDVNAIFTVDEETGAQGAGAIPPELLERTQYFIEIDRRGNSDLIIDICGLIASDEFITAIDKTRERYGFEYEYGMFTDIDVILDEVHTSAINLSAGYYEPHTAGEYVKLPELENTIDLAGAILDTVERKKYPIEPRSYSYANTWRGQGRDRALDFPPTDYAEELELLQQEALYKYSAEVVELITEAYYLGQESAQVRALDYIEE